MKKLIHTILIIIICLLNIIPAHAIELNSNYAYAYNTETDVEYINIKATDKIYPASMTKIVTLMCALEKIDDITQTVTITYKDLEGLYEANASVCGFSAGETVTIEDLLYGVLLPSGADACNALARITYGSTDQLVEAMNNKVKQLELKSTNFTNVTGLHDDNHYTSCYDMARLLKEALKNKTFKEVFETRQYTTSSKDKTWYSSLKRGEIVLNKDTTCIDGGKSGFTYEARLTYAASMTIDGHSIISVVADADYNLASSNIADTLSIYEEINNTYQSLNVYNAGDELTSFKINKKSGQYTYYTDKDIDILLDKNINKEDLTIDIQLNNELTAPLQKNTQIGTITINHKETTLYSDNLYLYEDIETDIIGILDYYKVYIIGGCTILLTALIIIKKRR